MAINSSELLARRLVETYSNQLLRVAYSCGYSVSDAQDVCQDALLKRLGCCAEFESLEHERAWLIRVTINISKNLHRSLWFRRTVGLNDIPELSIAFGPDAGGILNEIQHLPVRYREVLVLYYYIGYNTIEIAELFGIRNQEQVENLGARQ